MHWKIERDPIYKKLYEKFGEEFIIGAGFIYDNSPINYPVTDDFDCTPISFMVERFRKSKNPAIILSTGSFCPLHDGHIEMMYKAREAVEASGYDVIGGYLAPDNDEYVLRKTNVLNIHERIRIIQKQIEEIDWLAVDPWSGVFRKYAENFTDIIYHLQMYIKRHLGKDIPIFYVCGGDNAHFLKAFTLEGHCVVVDRPGTDTGEKYKKLFNDRILYAYNDNDNSSTEVRKTFDFNKSVRKEKLYLRLGEYDPRQEEVIEELKKYYDEIIISKLENEKEVFSKISNNLISLDLFLKSEHNISISRQFDYFGGKFLGFTNRPETLLLDEQLDNIPKGEFFLFDDDIHTGKTIEYVKELLKNRTKVLGTISLTTSSKKEEILDCWDFYFNKRDSGLVILDSNLQNIRHPYIYPTVCPYQRCSIEKPLEFSIAIWTINRNYFKSINHSKNAVYCDKMISLLKYKSS